MLLVFGGQFRQVNPANRCGLRVALPPPTFRPREQADLARFRSSVRINGGSVYGVTGEVTAWRVTQVLAALRSAKLILCLTKIVILSLCYFDELT